MATPFLVLSLSLVFLSVNCLINDWKQNSDLIYEQNAARPSSASRFRRQSPLLGYKNYVQAAAVQPSVVVVPGVPNTVYRGSSYGTQSVPYGTQGTGYGVNRAPTVVVQVPDNNYMTPVVSNPYVPRL